MSDADAAVHDMTQMFLRAVDAAQPAQFMAQALPLLEADFHRLARTDAGGWSLADLARPLRPWHRHLSRLFRLHCLVAPKD